MQKATAAVQQGGDSIRHAAEKYGIRIGSTRLARRLCDLSSVGKFGRGGAKAKLSHGG